MTLPLEPTPAMIRAGEDNLISWVSPAKHAADCWRAMVKAYHAETEGNQADASAGCPHCDNTGWDYEADENCTCGSPPPDRVAA